MAEHLQFFFDPMCPYAYQTSVWIRDVRAQIGLDITWRFFSLEEVNRVEGKTPPVGTAVVVRLGTDARRFADPA